MLTKVEAAACTSPVPVLWLAAMLVVMDMVDVAPLEDAVVGMLELESLVTSAVVVAGAVDAVLPAPASAVITTGKKVMSDAASVSVAWPGELASLPPTLWEQMAVVVPPREQPKSAVL